MAYAELLWPSEVSVGRIVYPPGGTFWPRLQINTQLVMIHEGSMTVWIDGSAHHAGAESVFILFPGHRERFVFAADRPTRHSWLHALLPTVPDALAAQLNGLPRPLQLSAPMAALTQTALDRGTPRSAAATMAFKALASQMLWQYIEEAEEHADLNPASRVPSVVLCAQAFIRNRLQEPLTLRMIADAVAVSDAHLIRLFRQVLNTTPMAYVWQQRVSLGIQLLEQTGLSVGAIAERCGFQTSYHFSRRIRQATHMTPLSVRYRAWHSPPAESKD